MALFTTHFKQYERMTNPSQRCTVHQCQSYPRSVCNHCAQHFCHDHSDEHENQCSQTLPYLTDTIDKLITRISSVKPLCLDQLERWRQEAYQSIDRYCNLKRQDFIERKQENLTKELDHLRNRLDELGQEEDDVHDRLYQINHDMQLIEVKLIEENLIATQHLFPLPHAHLTISLKSSNETAIGTNERHLLVEREGKYLCLIDRNFTIINEIPFNHDGVHSICWSSTINQFIIITFKEVFILDEKTMMLEKCFISLNEDCWRGTCSDDTLFLSSAEWGSPIHEFDLRSQFK
jgi:hypothetical protein